jgi:hypothetical protein
MGRKAYSLSSETLNENFSVPVYLSACILLVRHTNEDILDSVLV